MHLFLPPPGHIEVSLALPCIRHVPSLAAVSAAEDISAEDAIETERERCPVARFVGLHLPSPARVAVCWTI